jgi:hypothetical protein
METRAAMAAFSQSEKIKAGIQWVSHCLGVFSHLTEPDKRGAEKIITVMVNQIAGEIELAERLTGDKTWKDAAKHMHTAVVMVNSGVAAEAGFHLTRAMSHVTTVGQRAMTRLKDKGLL